jgi:hypothetical protein
MIQVSIDHLFFRCLRWLLLVGLLCYTIEKKDDETRKHAYKKDDK